MFVARGGNARVVGRCSRSLWAKVNFLLFDRYIYFESRIGRHTNTKSESSSDSPLSAQQSVTKCIGHSAASVSLPARPASVALTAAAGGGERPPSCHGQPRLGCPATVNCVAGASPDDY